MGAETRFAVVLFGSLILWMPALSAVLSGDLDAGVAAIRFVMGAALVWAMVAGLNQLVTGYAVAPAEGSENAETDGPAERRRRTEDRIAREGDAETSTDGEAAPEAEAASRPPEQETSEV